MTRSYLDRPVAAGVVERVLAAGLRAPSAGFTQGIDLVVLEGRDETARYWDAALPADARARLPWPGLLAAPVLVVVVASEDAYRDRYAEPDKVPGGGPAAPWWYVDGGFVALLLQLAAQDAGLGALFFEAHRPEVLKRALAIPGGAVLVGTVAFGHPAPDRPSSSVRTRRRRPWGDVVHRGSW
jgi:nitroreductase